MWAASITAIALRVFLTPAEQIHTVPSQSLRYAIYSLAIFALANAAGTVLALLLTSTRWLPAVYLWLVPFGIILYPVLDPAAANFVHTGVTSHVAGPLAIAASLLWVLGILSASWVTLRLGGAFDTDPREAPRSHSIAPKGGSNSDGGVE